jgi:hypothetical protein
MVVKSVAPRTTNEDASWLINRNFCPAAGGFAIHVTECLPQCESHSHKYKDLLILQLLVDTHLRLPRGSLDDVPIRKPSQKLPWQRYEAFPFWTLCFALTCGI